MKDWKNLEPDITKLLTRHYTAHAAGRKVNKIVVHYNAGDLTVEGCWSVWQTREASAHYQVESSGRIGQLVYDKDIAWHAGVWNVNQESIGIEHANKPNGTITDACLDNGAHLVAALCLHYNLGRPEWLKNVFPHKHFKATACPGQIYGSQKDVYIQRAQYWYDVMTGATQPETEKTPLPDALKTYTDLDPNGWYISSIEYVVKKKYMSGYSATKFGPSDSLTRAQAVCIIAKMAGFEADDPYEDVKAQPFYYNSVEWAKENGIVSGDQKNFRPDDTCARQDFMVMLHNYAGGPKPVGQPTGYSDWKNVAPYAQNAVAWCVEQGIISGSGGKLNPAATCSRAEAAAMLTNFDKKVKK